MTRPEAMKLCQDMYGRWTSGEIQTYLAGHGVRVSVTTVKRWADPNGAEIKKRSETQRALERRRERRLRERMATLHERGLSYNAIAVVLDVDHGLKATEWQVRHALDTGRLSAPLREQVKA